MTPEAMEAIKFIKIILLSMLEFTNEIPISNIAINIIAILTTIIAIITIIIICKYAPRRIEKKIRKIFH